jgi:hypothetical protein
MKNLRTDVWKPERGELLDIISSPSRDHTVEMEESVPDAPGMPAAKDVRIPKISLKKLLASYVNSLSMID